MRVYLDSSAIIKRVVAEPQSDALVSAVDRHHTQGDLLVSSSLAWVEVARALRRRVGAGFVDIAADVESALSGVAEHPVAAEVVSLARRVRPHVLCSLDAVHLASALLVDADLLLTYDDRLAVACVDNGLAVTSPGR